MAKTLRSEVESLLEFIAHDEGNFQAPHATRVLFTQMLRQCLAAPEGFSTSIEIGGFFKYIDNVLQEWNSRTTHSNLTHLDYDYLALRGEEIEVVNVEEYDGEVVKERIPLQCFWDMDAAVAKHKAAEQAERDRIATLQEEGDRQRYLGLKARFEGHPEHHANIMNWHMLNMLLSDVNRRPLGWEPYQALVERYNEEARKANVEQPS